MIPDYKIVNPFKFNGIKITLRLKEEEIRNFYKFFSSLNIAISSEDKYLFIKNCKLEHNQYLNDKYLILEKLGIDIMSIKITNKEYLTITFKNIQKLLEFRESDYSKKELEVVNKYKQVYSKKSLVQDRFDVVKRVFSYIKSKGFEERTKIKKIYFCIRLDRNSYRDYHLIKYNTQVKKQGIFTQFSLERNKRSQTCHINSYLAIIDDPISFFKNYSSSTPKRNLPPRIGIGITNTEKEEDLEYRTFSNSGCKINKAKMEKLQIELKKIVEREKGFKGLFIVKDYANRFFLESKQYIKQLKVKEDTFTFYPNIDKNSSYFDLNNVLNKSFNIYASKKSRSNFSIATKEQFEINLIISKWTTRNKKYLSDDKSKHDFTLADKVDDILAQIESYTNMYQLVKINENLLEEIKEKKLTTRKKVEKELLNENAENIDIFSESLKSLLLKLFKK